MQITDLASFRAEFEPVWLEAEAIFYEGNRDAIAHVRLAATPMSETVVTFHMQVLKHLGRGAPSSEPLEVGGRWEHITASRSFLRGSGVIGGWWIWKPVDVVQAVLEAHDALAADASLDDAGRLKRLKVAYRDAVAPHRR